MSTICRKFFAPPLPAGVALIFLLSVCSWAASLDPPDTVLTGNFASSATKTGAACRTVTWNIDRGYDLAKIESTLKKLQAPLLFLQEVDLHSRRTHNADVARALAQALGYNYAFGTAFQEMGQSVEGQPGYQGQATLCRCPILNARVLRFKRQSNWWKPHGFIPNTGFFQRRLGGRIALVTELSLGRSRVVAYNVHFESRSAGAIQAAQLNELLADLDRYPPGTPAMIAGDLNSKYNPSEVLHFLQRKGFRSVLGEKIERTHVIIGYFDWIFYRGPWKVEDARVMRGSHASDHDPVVAQLRLDSR